MAGTVYLLHFDTPLGTVGRGSASHYLGYTSNLKHRLLEHEAGTSQARIVQVLRQRGGTFRLARTWRGTRTYERRLKKNGHFNLLCPICKEQRNHHGQQVFLPLHNDRRAKSPVS